MKVLLDTHTFLWFVLGDNSLSQKAIKQIENSQNDKFISPASYWEIAIKIAIGKYTLSQPYTEFIEKAIDENGFNILPILPKHTAILTSLPFHHRDPFDRLLIAQSIVENIPIISCDSIFDECLITRIW